mmetsp:Transcript_12513/g.17981  ORF Transcript_12513/g.17981 Transcript_12513/m.17981 type:complete len:104 (-) Transcript_12513:159-470(-)
MASSISKGSQYNNFSANVPSVIIVSLSEQMGGFYQIFKPTTSGPLLVLLDTTSVLEHSCVCLLLDGITSVMTQFSFWSRSMYYMCALLYRDPGNLVWCGGNLS